MSRSMYQQCMKEHKARESPELTTLRARKSKQSTPVRAWGVFSPRGKLLRDEIHWSKHEAIYSACLYGDDYTVRRVTITEEK